MIDFFTRQIWCESFLTSLISGFITSIFFLFMLLLLFRPRIKIGSNIATHNDDLDPQKRLCWAFKVVNLSVFSAFDVKVEVCQMLVSYGPSGSPNYRTVPIQLLKEQYSHVAPFRLRWSDKSDADFALWFITYEDVGQILKASSQTKLQIRVMSRHALTGLGSVVTREYTISDIKVGTFKSGNNFYIV